jgi:hypothetical protein
VLRIGFSARTIARLWKRGKPGECVQAAVILYALLTPRMMAYSYLLVVVPSLALFSPILRRIGGTVAVTAILISQAVLAPALGLDYSSPWLANLPFLLLLGIWLVTILHRGGWRGAVPTS